MIKWILISIPIILGLCVFIESFSEFSKKCDEILKGETEPNPKKYICDKFEGE